MMWSVQAVCLRKACRPVRLRIDHADLPRRLQRVNRVAANAAFAAVLVAYPLLRGWSPVEYYIGVFPLDGRAVRAVQGFTAVLIYLGLLYAVWLASDNVYLRPLRDPRRLALRLAAVPFSALIGAGVEELLFRAMLLQNLRESLPAAPAVAVGTLVFAGAHYIRRVKRYWTFPGHLALGMMLCVAFAVTGNGWLSLGLHAGGILLTLGLRPLIRSVGPPWLVGASIYPYAGLAGVIGLSVLTLNMWYLYGADR
ncbi:MAG: CPBP family intramembrane metalloprotease [Phycisphaerae bacterium]